MGKIRYGKINEYEIDFDCDLQHMVQALVGESAVEFKTMEEAKLQDFGSIPAKTSIL